MLLSRGATELRSRVAPRLGSVRKQLGSELQSHSFTKPQPWSVSRSSISYGILPCFELALLVSLGRC